METNRLKFGTIVVATDMKSTASSTLRYALAVAQRHQSTLVIVHVIDPMGYAFPAGTPPSLAADKEAREELESSILKYASTQGHPPWQDRKAPV